MEPIIARYSEHWGIFKKGGEKEEAIWNRFLDDPPWKDWYDAW
jgi:hypothetical protein